MNYPSDEQMIDSKIKRYCIENKIKELKINKFTLINKKMWFNAISFPLSAPVASIDRSALTAREIVELEKSYRNPKQNKLTRLSLLEHKLYILYHALGPDASLDGLIMQLIRKKELASLLKCSVQAITDANSRLQEKGFISFKNFRYGYIKVSIPHYSESIEGHYTHIAADTLLSLIQIGNVLEFRTAVDCIIKHDNDSYNSSFNTNKKEIYTYDTLKEILPNYCRPYIIKDVFNKIKEHLNILVQPVNRFAYTIAVPLETDGHALRDTLKSNFRSNIKDFIYNIEQNLKLSTTDNKYDNNLGINNLRELGINTDYINSNKAYLDPQYFVTMSSFKSCESLALMSIQYSYAEVIKAYIHFFNTVLLNKIKINNSPGFDISSEIRKILQKNHNTYNYNKLILN